MQKDFPIPSFLEKLHLALPLVLFIFIIASSLTPTNLLTLKYNINIQIIIDIMFFGLTHIIVTYLILRYFKGSRRWIGQQNKWRLILVCTLITLTAFSMTITVNYGLAEKYTLLGITTREFVQIITYFLIVAHFVFQNMGVSSYMNYRDSKELDDKQRGRLNTLKNKEKIVFKLIFIQIFLGFILKILNLTGPNSAPNTIFYFYLASSYGTILFLFFVNYINYPANHRKKKLIFLSRLLFYPVVPFISIFNISRMIMHSTEYFFIFGQMIRPRSNPFKNRQLLTSAILSFIFLSFITLLAYQWPTTNKLLPYSPLMKLIETLSLSLYWSLVFCHYYFDRILFNFKKEETQRFINRHLA